ncbi:MAG TPA: amino acid adenylation domain-containing protein, partial [Chloroflexota bacterium]|nr:amino acid adenylation domain-containing protein [Chloroflexota bacterium]
MTTLGDVKEPALAGDKDALLSLLLAEEGFDPEPAPGIRHRGSDGPAPLSFSQERLWFLDQLTAGSAAYTMYMARRLSGRLDVAALRQALDEIVRRHQSLRTTVGIADDRPVQVIMPAGGVPLPLVDLRGWPLAEREDAAQRLVARETHTPFDLAVGPLLRACLARLEDEEHLFVLTMHHIVSDGWSMGILEQELSTLYTAFCRGQPSPLPELAIQYADYAGWQHEWLQGAVLQEQLDYWKRQLAGAPALLELPTDRPRPPTQSFAGASHAFTLSPALSAGLRALSKEAGVTLFMTVLAALQTLLSRYARQDDVCVGSFIAGRTRAETEGLIGFFINNIALRTDLSGDPPFRELLGRVRDVTLAAYAYQEVPFEAVVQALQPVRDARHSPLFQVILVLQNMPAPAVALPELIVRPVSVESQRSNFDLTLWLAEAPDQLMGSLQYSTALFDASTIEWMVAHLCALLAGIVATPEARLSALPLLSGPERRLLQQWATTTGDPVQANPTAPAPVACIHQLIASQAKRTPDAVAVVGSGRTLTYSELDRRADRLAYQLRALGVEREALVGLCMDRSIDLVIGLLGILKAGAAYVPLDPAYPEGRLAFMLEDSQARVLVTQAHLQDRLPAGAITTICLSSHDVDDATAMDEPLSSEAATDGSAAYVMYTSGSTGQPKGVIVEHRALVNLVLSSIESYALEPCDRVLQFSSVSFDISVEEIFPCLARGATLVLRDDTMLSRPAAFLHACQERGITVLDLPTAFWHEMAADIASTALTLPPSLRLIIVGGERVLPERVAAWQERVGTRVRLVNTYGPTEATAVTTLFDTAAYVHGMGEPGDVPIGRPIRNAEVYVLDERLQPAPIGVPGEIYIGGAGLARGYLNRPALTATKFVPHPFREDSAARLYRTGDLARYLPGGTVEFLGRLDDQVKIHGFRIELGEVEATLRRQAGVRDAVAVARQDGGGEQCLVAYVVPAEGGEIRATALRQALRESLPEYMVPTAIVPLEALPLTPNGKVDRGALPTPVRSDEERQAFVAPRDGTEQQLAQIWEEVLGVRPIGVTDSFFALGGHSLLAVRLMGRIEQAFGRDLPLATLFQDATIEALARTLRQQDVPRTWSPLVGLQTMGTRQPFFCVHAGGGNVFCYRDLSHDLGTSLPFYGLQARGLAPDQEPATRVE